MASPSGPIRRAQLIAPFGVGAMTVVPGGVSLITGGLDYWFKRSDVHTDGVPHIDITEFQVEEWRLQRLLRVSHFRLPPDYREPRRNTKDLNVGLSVPFLRFPQWHFCPFCQLLLERPLFEIGTGKGGRIECPECGKGRHMYQVPFIAMCENGHLQDFPWREWVHRSVAPACRGKLRLIATGSATLGGQRVTCECGASRTLAEITQADEQSTYLSRRLDENNLYLCRGYRPWLGPDSYEPCNSPIRGSLRSASNVYFAQVFSSLYLPRGTDTRQQEIIGLLERPPISTLFMTLLGALDPAQRNPDVFAKAIIVNHPKVVEGYSQEELTEAIRLKLADQIVLDSPIVLQNEDPETQFRREECHVLRTPRDDRELRIRQADLKLYGNEVRSAFARIMLVDKLRETRVLAGFTRVFPENHQSLEQRKAALWLTPPEEKESWLPAYVVYGEGIYLELDEDRLRLWEAQPDVVTRVEPLITNYATIQQNRHLRDRRIGPRFVLLHTLSHVLMNQLTFDCGYSSAALRERLYVSSNPEAPMAGLLIYTAAGDAEGTMGGLVRMGRPGYIEPVLAKAIANARWCSADPVCMELGSLGGQGPDSCNLAACHNCALIPETACEEFNRFLDRGLLIGDLDNLSIGYFNSLP